jgi:hypothetical protein
VTEAKDPWASRKGRGTVISGDLRRVSSAKVGRHGHLFLLASVSMSVTFPFTFGKGNAT